MEKNKSFFWVARLDKRPRYFYNAKDTNAWNVTCQTFFLFWFHVCLGTRLLDYIWLLSSLYLFQTPIMNICVPSALATCASHSTLVLLVGDDAFEAAPFEWWWCDIHWSWTKKPNWSNPGVLVLVITVAVTPLLSRLSLKDLPFSFGIHRISLVCNIIC